ncbi:hypothetical protein JCM10212_002733, partial [Sporobolomyces blumeae]
LQRSINAERAEAAQRKLALIQGRAWDAEKLLPPPAASSSSDDGPREPMSETHSNWREPAPPTEARTGRELQYPSHEYRHRRRACEQDDRDAERDGDAGRPVVSSVDEAARRRLDSVRNDEVAWETVEHFEGKGRAKLVTVRKGGDVDE